MDHVQMSAGMLLRITEDEVSTARADETEI